MLLCSYLSLMLPAQIYSESLSLAFHFSCMFLPQNFFLLLFVFLSIHNISILLKHHNFSIFQRFVGIIYTVTTKFTSLYLYLYLCPWNGYCCLDFPKTRWGWLFLGGNMEFEFNSAENIETRFYLIHKIWLLMLLFCLLCIFYFDNYLVCIILYVIFVWMVSLQYKLKISLDLYYACTFL